MRTTLASIRCFVARASARALPRALAPALALALASCAGAESALDTDLAASADLAHRDMVPPRDLTTPPPPDLWMGPDLSCRQGDPDHCGSCQTICPPGKDDTGTARVCVDNKSCNFTCLGEFYDVDGRDDNGCEAADAPAQDTPMTAVAITLPDKVDPNFMSNPLNLLGKVYSDKRDHAEAPLKRDNGREDWYAVNAVGAGDPNSKMGACLSINSLPPDNTFEVCISDIGKTLLDPKACATTSGMMSSVCVSPPGMTDAGNPYYVRVRKLAGTPSVNGYALFLKH